MSRGRKSVIEKIYRYLRDDITFGKFRPGEHLPENALCKGYRVSRATMREVIGRLAIQGFLTVERDRGAIVTKLSPEDVDIIYGILIRCESFATGLFARKGNPSLIKKLELLHMRMQRKDVQSNYREWLRLNDDFHRVIYDNCGSSILSQLIHHTRLRIYRFRQVETHIRTMNLYNRQHGSLITAMRDGDKIAAEKIMANHLESARKHRIELLTEIGQLL